MLQTEQPAGPPPPPGFEAYKKNAASGGVMGMIQQIINDAKAMEAEVIRSEEDAQKAGWICAMLCGAFRMCHATCKRAVSVTSRSVLSQSMPCRAVPNQKVPVQSALCPAKS